MSDNRIDNSLIFLTNKTATLTPQIGDCKWIFPTPVLCRLDEEMLIGLAHLTMPVSWHVINPLNNRLTCQPNGGGEVTVLLEIGDYSTTSLVTYLNTLVVGLSFALNQSSSLLTITAPVGFRLSGSALRTLGISNDSVTFPPSGQIITDRMDLSSGLHAVYISVDVTTSNIDTRGAAGTRCLGVVPITAGYGELLTFSTDRPIMFETPERTLSSIEVRLETSTGELIPIGANVNWEVSLLVAKRKNPTANKDARLTAIHDSLPARDETQPPFAPSRTQGKSGDTAPGSKTGSSDPASPTAKPDGAAQAPLPGTLNSSTL